MDLEEQSYSTEHLGLVGVRTEVRNKKAENLLLFPYVKGTKHPRALVFLGVKSPLPVEGRALTPSCESTRITTGCWTIIDRKTLDFTKEDTPRPRTEEKPQ